MRTMSTRLCILLAMSLLIGCDKPTPAPASRPADHGWTGPPAPVAVRAFAFADPDAVILITGGTHGRLETCNCKDPVVGGLSRRGGLIASYRAAFDPVLLVDAGDCFWVEPEDPRNAQVLKGYRLLGYDAVALGDHEWGALPGGRDAMLRAEPMGYLATNVTVKSAEVPVASSVVRRAGGARIAFLSYLGPSTMGFLGGMIPEKLQLSGPDAVARKAGELKKDGCVVVLLAHAGEDDLRPLGKIPDVDLVIRGDTTTADPEVKALGSIPMVKVGGADQVGALALKIENGRIVRRDFRLEVVGLEWPEDLRMMKVFHAYAHQALRAEYDTARGGPFTQRDPRTCARCHPRRYRAWVEGPHARSGRVLGRAGGKTDPDCLTCHTAGFRMEGGFRSFKDTPSLGGVGCQQCHRFDPRGQIDRTGKCPPAPKVTKDTCALCHMPRVAPDFDYDKYVRKIACTKAPRETPTTKGAKEANR